MNEDIQIINRNFCVPMGVHIRHIFILCKFLFAQWGKHIFFVRYDSFEVCVCNVVLQAFHQICLFARNRQVEIRQKFFQLRHF